MGRFSRLRTVLRYGVYAGGTAGAVGLLWGYSLSRKYPLVERPAFLKTSDIKAIEPEGLGEGETIRAIIANPPKAALIDPLNTYLDVFYSSPFMRLEAWVTRKFDYKSKAPRPHNGRVYVDGLLPELLRRNDMVLHWWSAPGAEGEPTPAGEHLMGAFNSPAGLELVFSSRQFEPPYAPQDPKVITILHLMYMRILFDYAVRKIKAMAKDGK